MKRLLIYVDTSVVGGCEEPEFSEGSLRLWRCFIEGRYRMALSELTLNELKAAPASVRRRIEEVPSSNVTVLAEGPEATELAQEYLARGILGPGSHADARHVALATVGHADILVSWNFRHIVNVSRIWRFHAINVELGYGMPEIRTPLEVMDYGERL